MGAAGGREQLSGIDALDEYGRGNKDPLTGLFDYYEDLPPELSAVDQDTGRDIGWLAILEQWPLIEGGFHDHFGVDLVTVWATATWRWFRTRVTYLLASDSALGRHFAPKPEEADRV